MYWLKVCSCDGDETKLFWRGAAPAIFGSGISVSSCRAAGLMRLSGMTLPGNGSPVSGSRIGLDRKLRLPARSAAVATTACRVNPLVSRKPS